MFLIGNWKMHGSCHEIRSFIEQIDTTPSGVSSVLCFPFPYLKEFAPPLALKGYGVGAQECSHESLGCFTGQVSASMLKDVGCGYVLVGHPERCDFETDEHIYQKAQRAVEVGLTPIICVTSLDHLKERVPSLPQCVIAYEPAVGADTLPSDLAHSAQKLKEGADPVPVLYGGGVNSGNFEDIARWFDGILVGRASLSAHSWNHLLKGVKGRDEVR